MGSRNSRRRRAIIRRRIFVCSVLAVLVLAVIGVTFAIRFVTKGVKPKETKKNNILSSSVSSKEEVNQVKEPEIISSATVSNTGDIIIHSTVLDGAKTSNGYDFSALFKNTASYFDKDLNIANLEITFGGKESGAFSGYPAFNTPDNLSNVIKNAGFDLLLTANNHCYDTGFFGLKRTVKVLKAKELDFIGTKELESDSFYRVKDVNGVKIGMICYTYENACQTAGRKSINGNVIASDANSFLNSFSYEHLDEFYSDAKQNIEVMKNEGADAIVFYMHWGEEYQLKQNNWQSKIAQKLCDMGVDIIIGGHPHVIQPIELLHSSVDEAKTTVCLYSMGNAISNQRQELMHPECTTGHTEDGMIFYYTFDKYSDGKTVLSNIDLVPTWVDKYHGGSGYLYSMIPLKSANAGSKYNLSSDSLSRSKRSYTRTKNTVAKGLTECQKEIGCDITFK